MPESEYAVTTRRRIAAPPPLVWALVADTNRWDRAAGLTPGRYSFEPVPTDGGPARERVGSATQLGLAIRWYEPPYEWIEGRHVWGERRFLTGPVARGGFRVDLRPAGGGTDVEARAYVTGQGAAAGLVGGVMRLRFRAALGRYLDALEQVLTSGAVVPDYGWSDEPPAALVHRAMLLGGSHSVASGPVSPVSEADLLHRARRFEAAPVAPELRARLLAHLRGRPDEDLAQVRPFELARAWGADKREVLRACLHAARAGLLDLRWQLNCPTCRVASDVVDSLAAVGRASHCDACDIAFDLDFAAHVEAVFSVSPAVRRVERAVYCASSPWFRPHVWAQLAVGAGGTREARAALPRGALALRTLQGRRRALLDGTDAPPASLRVRVTDEAVHVAAEGRVAPGADTAVAIANETARPVVLLVERAGWSADVVLGSAIATLPEFHDLFATEAPAAGVELTVGTLTMLFSDLTGSTALYERVGDARAFALVQEHFGAMTAAVARHGDAVVKTMGDAVMAAFAAPAPALLAALEMVRETERAHGREGLAVKLGLHEGPCLAVRANERLDFFGTTVNVAARLQARAAGSQVVVLAELLEHPEVARIVRERGLPTARLEANLKGIRETKQLVALGAGARAQRAGVAS